MCACHNDRPACIFVRRFVNHEKSKKHKENVALLKKLMVEEEEEDLAGKEEAEEEEAEAEEEEEVLQASGGSHRTTVASQKAEGMAASCPDSSRSFKPRGKPGDEAEVMVDALVDSEPCGSDDLDTGVACLELGTDARGGLGGARSSEDERLSPEDEQDLSFGYDLM